MNKNALFCFLISFFSNSIFSSYREKMTIMIIKTIDYMQKYKNYTASPLKNLYIDFLDKNKKISELKKEAYLNAFIFIEKILNQKKDLIKAIALKIKNNDPVYQNNLENILKDLCINQERIMKIENSLTENNIILKKLESFQNNIILKKLECLIKYYRYLQRKEMHSVEDLNFLLHLFFDIYIKSAIFGLLGDSLFVSFLELIEGTMNNYKKGCEIYKKDKRKYYLPKGIISCVFFGIALLDFFNPGEKIIEQSKKDNLDEADKNFKDFLRFQERLILEDNSLINDDENNFLYIQKINILDDLFMVIFNWRNELKVAVESDHDCSRLFKNIKDAGKAMGYLFLVKSLLKKNNKKDISFIPINENSLNNSALNIAKKIITKKYQSNLKFAFAFQQKENMIYRSNEMIYREFLKNKIKECLEFVNT